MPIYQLRCVDCKNVTEVLCCFNDRDAIICEKCGGKTENMISPLGALITDTSFGYTGLVDERLGGPPIKGRADWYRRVKEKGLVPITFKDIE